MTKESASRKPHKEATPEEVRSRQDSMKTQGKKGAKLPRINMGFTPDNYEYLQTVSAMTGTTMTSLCNEIIAAHRKAHPDLLKKAKEFQAQLQEGGLFTDE